MPKYRVFGTIIATVELGEFEADSLEEAIRMGWDASDNGLPTLCNKCSDEIELSGDLDEVNAEEL